jgi:hypothetical protein
MSPSLGYFEVTTFGINQLPVSATRQQHESQICFAVFIERKITKLPKIKQQLKLNKNKRQFVILRILELLKICLPIFMKSQTLLN